MAGISGCDLIGQTLATWLLTTDDSDARNRLFARLSPLDPVAYAEGLTVTNPRTTVTWEGNVYIARPDQLPFTTGAELDPLQWRMILNNGTGPGGWQPVVAELQAQVDELAVAVAEAPGTLADLVSGPELTPSGTSFPDVPSVSNAQGPVDAVNDSLLALAERSEQLRKNYDSLGNPTGAEQIGYGDNTLAARLNGAVSVTSFTETGRSDAQALALAANQALAAQRPLLIDRPLSTDTPLQLNVAADASFEVVGNANALVTYTGSGAPWLRVVNSASAPLPVSSIDEMDYDLSEGGSVTTRVNRLTIPGHNYAVGNVIKVFSDDFIPGREADGERRGEFFVVGAVVGDFVYSTSLLFDTYTSGTFTVKPGTGRASVRGLTLVGAGDVAAAQSGISFEGFVGPRFDIDRIEAIRGPALQLVGCAFSDVRVGVIQQLPNSASQLGYGINDSSGFFNHIHDTTGIHTRHVQTTNVESTTAGDGNWRRRGRNIGLLVSGCVGLGNGGAFDTHPDALYTTYNNCISNGTYRGFNVGGAGFQSRGAYAVYNACVSINDHIGVLAYDYDAATQFPSSVVINALQHKGRLCVGATGGSTKFVKLAMNNVQSEGVASLLRSTATLAKLSNCVKTLTAAAPASTQALDLTNSRVTADKLTFDITQSSLTSHRIAVLRDAASSLTVDSDVLDSAAAPLGAIAELSGTDATIDATIRKTANSQPSVSNPGAAAVVRRSILAAGTNMAGYNALTYASTPQTLAINNVSDPVMLKRIQVTSGADVTIGSIGAGARQGQMLVIANRESSNGSIIISAAAAAVGSARTIPPGLGFTLVWNGQSWYPGSF